MVLSIPFINGFEVIYIISWIEPPNTWTSGFGPRPEGMWSPWPNGMVPTILFGCCDLSLAQMFRNLNDVYRWYVYWENHVILYWLES